MTKGISITRYKAIKRDVFGNLYILPACLRVALVTPESKRACEGKGALKTRIHYPYQSDLQAAILKVQKRPFYCSSFPFNMHNLTK